jgi:hypothetical protein
MLDAVNVSGAVAELSGSVDREGLRRSLEDAIAHGDVSFRTCSRSSCGGT